MPKPTRSPAELDSECDRITSRRDMLRRILWATSVGLVAVVVSVDRSGLVAAAETTASSFATVAALVAGGAIADRLGAFRVMANLVLSERIPTVLTSLSVLALTAVTTGAFNLDVAAVVAPPLAIRAAGERGLNPGRLVVATALTANATSFLLPTSNVTTLLLLDQSQISVLGYLRQGFLPWLLVSIVTVLPLAALQRGSSSKQRRAMLPAVATRPVLPAVLDLLPMFVIASAIRALLRGGLVLHGGFTIEFVAGSLLAAGANNLPAAAAVRTPSGWVPWAVIWAMAIGPNLLVTGSVATMICRRTALDVGARFEAWLFSLLGAAMLPLQFFAASLGLALATMR